MKGILYQNQGTTYDTIFPWVYVDLPEEISLVVFNACFWIDLQRPKGASDSKSNGIRGILNPFFYLTAKVLSETGTYMKGPHSQTITIHGMLHQFVYTIAD